MKKTLILLLIAVSFSACSKAKEGADKLVEDVQDSYKKVAEEVTAVKDKTIETVNDIETAVDKVKEAKAAVKEVTE